MNNYLPIPTNSVEHSKYKLTDFSNLYDKRIQSILCNYKHIDLNNKGIISFHIPVIVKLLEQNKYIISLNLSNNQIGSIGIEYLMPFLIKNKTLKILNLHNNHIHVKGLRCITNILKYNKSLTELNIKYNWFNITIDYTHKLWIETNSIETTIERIMSDRTNISNIKLNIIQIFVNHRKDNRKCLDNNTIKIIKIILEYVFLIYYPS